MKSWDDVSAACAAVSRLLREGRLSELPEVAASLEAAIEAAALASPPDPEGMRQEVRTLKRQLEAAARGIRSAQARLSDIRAARQAVTYDGAGRRSGIRPAPSVARRY